MKDKVIYKYPLKALFGKQNLTVPEGAQIIKLALQNEIPTIWAIVDLDWRETENWSILTIETGNPDSALIFNSLLFIDTYFLNDFVFHVFIQE